MHEKKHPPQPDPTPAADILTRRIAERGFVSVAEFMNLAASHYYASAQPFGEEGDFITSPDISQMFGEMIGAWMIDLWLQSGQPQNVQLIELGPGRGTLAADIMRTVSHWPEFKAAMSLHLVEASPQLRQKQAEALKGYRPTWYDRLEEVPEGTCYIIANEFFDALPIHQFIKKEGAWMERCVTQSAKEAPFTFTHRKADIDIAAIMPQEFLSAPEDSIFEISPASLSVLDEMCRRISAYGGAGLIIDYGHSQSGLGDTLQAVKGHRYADVLAAPGRQDITAHVDFGVFKTVAEQKTNVWGALAQGEFLSRLGIFDRAEVLRQNASEKQEEDILRALHRLVAPAGMGTLFKAMALTPRESTIIPAGFGMEKDHKNESPESRD